MCLRHFGAPAGERSASVTVADEVMPAAHSPHPECRGRWELGFSLVSQISRDEVAHLARLARLALTETELDSFAGQLDAILTHVSQIQAVDVTGVEATDNPLKDVNVTRP